MDGGREKMDREQLLGGWRLVSFVYESDDGSQFFPYGREAKGLIIYEAGGCMSAVITRSDRVRLSTEDFGLLPDHEKIALAKGFMNYAGTYEVLEDRIMHHIEIGYFPNWAGTTFIRFPSVHDDYLTLTTPPASLRGKHYTGRLVWQKVQPSNEPTE